MWTHEFQLDAAFVSRNSPIVMCFAFELHDFFFRTARVHIHQNALNAFALCLPLKSRRMHPTAMPIESSTLTPEQRAALRYKANRSIFFVDQCSRVPTSKSVNPMETFGISFIFSRFLRCVFWQMCDGGCCKCSSWLETDGKFQWNAVCAVCVTLSHILYYVLLNNDCVRIISKIRNLVQCKGNQQQCQQQRSTTKPALISTAIGLVFFRVYLHTFSFHWSPFCVVLCLRHFIIFKP